MNMEEFARAGYKVYAPDAVGFGSTEIVSGNGISASEFVAAFMDEMGIAKAHFVGNSMGSMDDDALGFGISRTDQELDSDRRRAAPGNRGVARNGARAGQDGPDGFCPRHAQQNRSELRGYAPGHGRFLL